MATRFWVGGTGTWDGSTTTNWAATSGGAGGASAPAVGDIVILDSNSGVGTITRAAGQTCGSLLCDGTGVGASGTYAGTLSTAAAGFSIGGVMGNVNLTSGMTLTGGTAAWNFAGTGTCNFKTAGQQVGGFTVNTTGSVILTDANTVPSTATVTLTQGTLNTNGQTCSWGIFNASGTITRTLTLGTSTITLTGAGAAGIVWNIAGGSALTGTASGSTLIFTGNAASAAFNSVFTYGTVIFNGTGPCFIGGSPTFTSANFTYAPTAGVGNAFQIATVTGMVVTTAMTLTGAAAPNAPMFQSQVVGTPKSVVGNGTVTLTGRMDFEDIAASGTATFDFSTSGGDCQGNSGITFATPQTNFWVGGNANNWSSASAWASSTGGTAGTGRVPFPQDTANVDANAGFTAAQTITIDTPRMGTVDFTGLAVNINWSQTLGTTCFGNYTVPSGGGVITRTSSSSFSLTFSGRGAQTVNAAGWVSNNLPATVFTAPGGTYTLQSAIGLVNASTVTLVAGTLTTANFAVNVVNFTNAGSTQAKVLNLGSSVVSVLLAWIATTTAFTLNAGTSVILIGGSGNAATGFTGAGLTYSTLQIAPGGTGPVTITGANTFTNLICNGTKQLTFQHGVTQTITTAAGWQVAGVANGYLALPGVAGNYASTPDAAALEITGDIDIRVQMAIPSWSAPVANMSVVGKWGTVTTKSYALGVAITTGRLQLSISTDGSTSLVVTSTVAPAFGANATGWVRATRVQSTGVVTFYTSTDGVTYTPLGTTVVLAAGSAMFNSSSPVEIGSVLTGTAVSVANLYRAQIYNGIAGTLVLDADFTTKAVGANTFTESSSNAATVTINGASAQQGDGRVLIASDLGGTGWTLSCTTTGQGVGVWVYNASLKDSLTTGGATFNSVAANVNLISNDASWASIGSSFIAEIDCVSSASGSLVGAAQLSAVEIDASSHVTPLPAGMGSFVASISGVSDLQATSAAMGSLNVEIDGLSSVAVGLTRSNFQGLVSVTIVASRAAVIFQAGSVAIVNT